jgi:CheY-like chemotaxis protein
MKNLNILIVEDGQSQRRCSAISSTGGYSVAEAETARRHFPGENRHFDLLLLDYKMPVWTACRFQGGQADQSRDRRRHRHGVRTIETAVETP